MDRLISPERQRLHYHLGRFLWTQGEYRNFAAMLLLELYSLLKGILFVGVDDELRVRSIDGLSIRSYSDAGRRVRDASHTDNNFQQSTTFSTRNPSDA